MKRIYVNTDAANCWETGGRVLFFVPEINEWRDIAGMKYNETAERWYIEVFDTDQAALVTQWIYAGYTE